MTTLTGVISQWNEQKGFGFVLPDDQSARVFIHVTGLRNRAHRPRNGDKVGYRIDPQTDGKLRAVDVYLLSDPHQVEPGINKAAIRKQRERLAPRHLSLKPFMAIAAVVIVAIFAYRHLNSVAALPSQESQTEFSNYESDPAPSFIRENDANTSSAFQCESGKSHCGEMRSCAEAVFYLKHCPGTIMDGDGDGKPCEDQWCGH